MAAHRWRCVPIVSARRRGVLARTTSAALLAGALACGGIADDSKLPPDVQDPATLKTPSGAVARYRSAIAYMGGALDRVITASGILTDELAALPTPLNTSTVFGAADSRTDLSGLSGSSFGHLHMVRAQARDARGFLAAYAPDSSPALQGHMYALEAYAEVMLADLFCSGIPLSTVDFEGSYTLAAGSTTSEVYRHAVALFDSALAISGDSAGVQQLAAVGKGRALLALDNYAEAAAAVSAVSSDYRYQVQFNHSDDFILELSSKSAPDSAALWYFHSAYGSLPGMPSVADKEGENGLDYRSSADPRTPATLLGTDALGGEMYFPAIYPEFGAAMFTLASGIEARLIEAEAALKADAADGQWLTTLNQLRQTVGLADTTDPGTPESRIDLLFRERAFWLFLTGHREGDLRRLVRQYLRAPGRVYPSGIYPGGTGAYGTEVVIPVPRDEQERNPKYTGCFDRNA